MSLEIEPGLADVVATHFGYEERLLHGVLERLDPGDVGVARLLGPLA